MDKEILLAEVIATKFSHDLAGLVGAVNNGLEMLNDEDDPDMKAQAEQMALESASEIIARLKYYRECYGNIKSDIGVGLEEIKQKIAGYFAYSKVNVRVNSEGYEVDQATKKSLFVGLLVVSSGLIRGGEINVDISENEVEFSGGGDTVKFKEGYNELLSGNSTEFDGTNVNAYYLYKLSENTGKITKFSYTDDKISLVIK